MCTSLQSCLSQKHWQIWPGWYWGLSGAFFCLVYCQFLVAVCSAYSSVFLLPQLCPASGRWLRLCTIWPRPCQCTGTGWHREGMGRAVLVQGEGGQQAQRGSRGTQGAVDWDCLCRERNTGDVASGGHIRAREGETRRLCLKVGAI